MVRMHFEVDVSGLAGSAGWRELVVPRSRHGSRFDSAIREYEGRQCSRLPFVDEPSEGWHPAGRYPEPDDLMDGAR